MTLNAYQMLGGGGQPPGNFYGANLSLPILRPFPYALSSLVEICAILVGTKQAPFEANVELLAQRIRAFAQRHARGADGQQHCLIRRVLR